VKILAAVLVSAAWLVSTDEARGGQQPASQQPQEPEAPQTDLMDLWRTLRKKPPATNQPDADRRTDVVVVPVVAAKPTTGFRYGVGATIEFPLGDPRTTHISSLNTAVTGSTEQQFALFVAPTIYGVNRRWQFLGDDHYAMTLVPNAAVGNGPQPGSAVDIDYESLRFFNTFSWEFASHLYAGVGLHFERQSDIKAAGDEDSDFATLPFVTYSNANGFNLNTQTAAGLGLVGTFDNRDYPSDPSRGWFVSPAYKFYVDGFLGGDSRWQRLTLDVRTYYKIRKNIRHKIALWGYADLVTSGTGPYLSLPMIGGDPRGRSGRGYSQGQFRGERWLYGEMEYRLTLTSNGLLGMVLFANATTVSNPQADQQLFDAVGPAAGTGLRFRLYKRSRTNVSLDFGWGRSGSFGVYFGLGEAF